MKGLLRCRKSFIVHFVYRLARHLISHTADSWRDVKVVMSSKRIEYFILLSNVNIKKLYPFALIIHFVNKGIGCRSINRLEKKHTHSLSCLYLFCDEMYNPYLHLKKI